MLLFFYRFNRSFSGRPHYSSLGSFLNTSLIRPSVWLTGLTLVLLFAAITATAAPKKILVVGDSLSSTYKMPKTSGWVHLLSEKVKPEWQVINGAVSGATTAQGLNLLPNLLQTHKPELVILGLGGNDGLQGKPISYITNNLSKLITLAKKSGARVVLLGIRLPPNFGPRYTEPFFEQYRKLADKHNIAYLPFLLEGVGGNREMMMADGIHPKASAQARILTNVWSVLETQLTNLLLNDRSRNIES